jgi:hypothetical protein
MTAERFPIEATHIMMFARAIGDPNPAYDPGSPESLAGGEVLAPPTFTMASMQFDPENPLLPRSDEPWFGSGREPGFLRADSGGMLHAEQHFEYHQPLRAGRVLTASQRIGEEWEKQSRSGGTLRFTERFTDYLDAETGDLVVTARMVGVFTGPPSPRAENEEGS